MSVDVEEEQSIPSTIKEKCFRCLKGVNLIKTLVVGVCAVFAIEQISSAVGKLINIPVTTYTHFDFNRTLLYPSITLCREPPYKHDKLQEYGLYSHPRFTSTWRAFNFSLIPLDQLWEQITYNESEFFVQYGLNGSRDHVTLKETMGFVNGRCFTISPSVLVHHATKASGYSIMMKHDPKDVETSTSILPPGYHVYVHYIREPYTEVEVYNGGLVDYLYINTGETVDIKLTVDQYSMINDEEYHCTNEPGYSTNECMTQRIWDRVSAQVGCSGPWMTSHLPRCDNYTAFRNFISTYINSYRNHGCYHCPRICNSYLYNAFVTDRQMHYYWDSSDNRWRFNSADAALQSLLYIHFNGMMVSVYEERFNYDFNLFVSDLGGSVGFLLGLSVISLMSIFGKIWKLAVRPFVSQTRIKEDGTSISSASTLDVKSSKDYLDKLEDWNEKALNNFI